MSRTNVSRNAPYVMVVELLDTESIYLGNLILADCQKTGNTSLKCCAELLLGLTNRRKSERRKK